MITGFGGLKSFAVTNDVYCATQFTEEKLTTSTAVHTFPTFGLTLKMVCVFVKIATMPSTICLWVAQGKNVLLKIFQDLKNFFGE